MSNAVLQGFSPLVTSSRLLNTWTVPGADTRLRLRQGSGGFLLVHLATRFDRNVEQLKEPLLDDWGHAFRAVRGFSTFSRHAYGLAEDLNATDHPLGVDHTFTAKERDTIHAILKRYDGCIRWGGDYSGRKDAMHFEINKALRDVERVARELADTKRGKQILDANPGQRKIIFS